MLSQRFPSTPLGCVCTQTLASFGDQSPKDDCDTIVVAIRVEATRQSQRLSCGQVIDYMLQGELAHVCGTTTTIALNC